MSHTQQDYFSQACENNKAPILEQLLPIFANSRNVLEIGSGTGQHAVYFAKHFPHLSWQTSDRPVYHRGIHHWLTAQPSNNLRSPLLLDVTEPWPLTQKVDAIFTANTLHIMSKAMVEAFFHGVGQHLTIQGNLCIYGPFNQQGHYSSDSNRQFDVHLKNNNPSSGIKALEWIERLANQQGLKLKIKENMPANNLFLHFKKENESFKNQ
ncbi:DUF938 domain-containing protein [Shewanella surugensis]|uniref:Class I SAM-dependent methyltransferase n=1 Tax=Shewanella surugensis TaxID=212020 RepID=A0ABT0LJH8_9GAMM|nr:DUF938 domain-containing protein [Shewanella surugensis]MCL1127859.1 class I SAM-dependent methyltransferase [Shewanella surugensis]